VLTAGMTAFYMFRLIILTFFGKPRMDHHVAEHVHESPRSMTVPLIILAFLSIVGGFIGVPEGLGGWSFPFDFYEWLEPVTGAAHPGLHASHALELGFGGLALLVAVTGSLIAFNIYLKSPERAEKMAASFPRLHNLLYHKYYVDEIYDAAIIQPTKTLCSALSIFDLKVIDGIVNGTAWSTVKASVASIWFDINIVDFLVNLVGAIINFFGGMLRKVQTGLVQNYALVSMSVFLLFIVVYYFFYAK
jgi:NADH-quinone oxidoreductase subunit L